MSNPNRHRRTTEIFSMICDLGPVAQAKELARLCGDDSELRAAVERMLAFDAKPGTLSDQVEPFIPPTEDPGQPAQHPERIGAYTIVEHLGEGGFGNVYLAQQEEPLRRRIALKVQRVGLRSPELRIRFDAERQALALLEHDGIAKLFEAGETADGYPYFAMEYVDGLSITDYCTQHDLTVEDRIALLVTVCKAVAHSHRRGIIHRDIKPDNVLVTVEDGVPRTKIIDFGIAKLTDLAATGSVQVTMAGKFVGTPIYMSPEQLDGSGRIDTRTDVYSLGVLLYELLTGATPVEAAELKGSGLNDIRQLVANSNPGRPSDRLSKIAPGLRKAMATDRWRQAIKGDLDWITMKALEHDPESRYASADALAADLQRYLDHQPIEARPQTTRYHLRKYACRHRVGLMATTLVVVAIIAGIAGSVFSLLKAERAEQEELRQRLRAEDERRATRVMNEFLTEGILAAAAPEALGYEVTLRQALDVASANIGDRFRDEKIADISIHLTVGRTYRRLGAIDVSARFTEHAAERAIAELDTADPLATAALHEMGELRRFQEMYEEGLGYYREAFKQRMDSLGPNHPDTLESEFGICASLSELRQAKESLQRLRPLLARCNQALGKDHRLSIRALRGVGLVALDLGPISGAIAPIDEALGRARKALGDDDPLVQKLLSDRIHMAAASKNTPDVRRFIKLGESLRKQRYSSDHPIALTGLLAAGQALSQVGDTDGAESRLKEAMEKFPVVLGPQSSPAQYAAAFYAEHCLRNQNYDVAIDVLAKLLRDQEQYGVKVPMIRLRALDAMAKALQESGRESEASEYRAELRELQPAQ